MSFVIKVVLFSTTSCELAFSILKLIFKSVLCVVSLPLKSSLLLNSPPTPIVPFPYPTLTLFE